jgi:hypothetical protein
VREPCCGAALTEPGNPVPAEISVTFRHKTQEGVAEWFKQNEQRSYSEALDEIIVSWGDPVLNDEGGNDAGKPVIGDDGQPVPYSKAALAQLLKNYAAATAEIIRAWQIALSESRVKN